MSVMPKLRDTHLILIWEFGAEGRVKKQHRCWMNILYKFWIFNVQDGDLCCAVLFSHVLILCDPMGCSLPGSSVHGNFPDEKFQEWVAMSSFGGGGGSSQSRDGSQVSCIGRGFFILWATREAREYWSGWLSLLQGILLTQKSNWGLLRCRWTLYQLSYLAQMVKNTPAIQETWVQSLGWEDILQEGMATYSKFLPGESPWTEKPISLQSMGSQRVRHDWVTKHTWWFTVTKIIQLFCIFKICWEVRSQVFSTHKNTLNVSWWIFWFLDCSSHFIMDT